MADLLADLPIITAVPDTWLAQSPGRRTLILGDFDRCPLQQASETPEQNDAPVSLLPPLKADDIERGSLLDNGISGGPCSLPYEDGRFDLVIGANLSETKEIGAATLNEIWRVLRPEGRLLIIDYLVPGSRLRGKKARRLREAGKYINAWYRLRNPRHEGFLSLDAWEQQLRNSQLAVTDAARRDITLDFERWSACYPLSKENVIRLQAMLLQAPEKACRFLTPTVSGARIAFRMIEVFILATASNNTM